MAKEMNKETLAANLQMLDKRGEQTLEAVKQNDPAAAEKLEKIGNLLRDESFAKAFACTNSAQEAVALFVERGVELTADEVTALAQQIRDLAQKLVENGGELSEEELENISGGLSAAEWGGMAISASPGAVLGGLIGSAICPGVGTGIGAAIGAAIGGGLFAFFNWLSK